MPELRDSGRDGAGWGWGPHPGEEAGVGAPAGLKGRDGAGWGWGPHPGEEAGVGAPAGLKGRESPPPPLSTYRLQLSPGFGFDEAAEVAPYLADLGVSHVYLSPCLQASPGSRHGYDVVDHHQVSTDLGGEEGYARLCAALGLAGLGVVMDVVPNHMAVTTPDNAWWWDVLENGPAAMHAPYFDVDWDPPEAKLRHKVLVPVLHDHYGRVLEAGELRLHRDGGSFTVRYRDRVLPLAPPSLDKLLRAAAEACQSAELEFVAAALGRLPPATVTERASVSERHRDQEVLRRRLADLCDADPASATAIDAEVQEVNSYPDALEALLDRQSYRLAHWRTAGQETNYRRFADNVNLVAVRVEDPRVFDDVHDRLVSWVGDGLVHGLRIDHVDGLSDPEGYLARLREETGGVWVVVEKVLQRHERLPSRWPVAGTTGYDFLNRAGGLFVDPDGQRRLSELYLSLTGTGEPFAEVVREKKSFVLRELLASELARLAHLFGKVCERHRRHRDHSRHELREVLAEAVACFPVYRSYVRPAEGAVSADDVAHVERAVSSAARRRHDLPADLFGFLGDLLLLRIRGSEPPGLRAPVDPVEGELATRFQQVSSATMAKGAEDTAFYSFVPLVSLNEVGGDPDCFGTSVEEFHQSCLDARADHPHAMVATSTHDTKRSEDVRARISLLSEIPEAWADAVRRWSDANTRHRPAVGVPGATAEYLLYQTLVGAWPLEADRAVAYMEKATREAKARTSWIHPDRSYDEGVEAFVAAVLSDGGFQRDVAAFVEPLVRPGRVTSLGQALARLTATGVPDTYQGSELWDLSLVDPDNRRPVDFDVRRRLLDELVGMKPEEVWERAGEGLPKLLVTHRALDLRRRRPDAFLGSPAAPAAYEPLAASGTAAGHVVAFARGGQVAAVFPRLLLGLERRGGWADTVVVLPPGRWRNVLTGDDAAGGEVAVGELLARFPVALLAAA